MEKPKIMQAKDLAQQNQHRLKNLQDRHEKLQKQVAEADREYQETVERQFLEVLEPFAFAFARLQNVDLDSPDLADACPAVQGLSVEQQKVSLGAVHGLVAAATGAAGGAAAAGATFAAVGALATASTGTAISTLSGAAATSATLAWLGGGSLAAGGAGVAGGTMVLASVVAVPAVLATGAAVSFVGRRELAKQRQFEMELRVVGSRLDADETRFASVRSRMRRSGQAMDRLAALAEPRLQWLDDISFEQPDYARFTPAERKRLGELVALITALDAVMRAPLVEEGLAQLADHRRALAAAKTAERQFAAAA